MLVWSVSGEFGIMEQGVRQTQNKFRAQIYHSHYNVWGPGWHCVINEKSLKYAQPKQSIASEEASILELWHSRILDIISHLSNSNYQQSF